MECLKCSVCESEFLPKKGGYNAKYCSKKCRNKASAQRLSSTTKINQRKRSYQAIKNNPNRYATHLSSGRNSKQTVRAWLAEYKINKGCVDCGYNRHFSALQLDHEGKKSAQISDLRSSKERILEEIEKGECAVRCAICHSVKTWATKNGIEYHPGLAK